MRNSGERFDLERLPVPAEGRGEEKEIQWNRFDISKEIKEVRQQLDYLKKQSGEREEGAAGSREQPSSKAVIHRPIKKKRAGTHVILSAVLVLSFFAAFFGIKIWAQSRSVPKISIGGAQLLVGQTTIRELKEQGFAIESYEMVDSLEKGKTKGYLMLRKGETDLGILTVQNTLEKTAALEDCVITALKVDGISTGESAREKDFRICKKSFYGLTQDGLKQVFMELNKSMVLLMKRRVMEGADVIYYCGNQQIRFSFDEKGISSVKISVN